jgi:hypothetical protein
MIKLVVCEVGDNKYLRIGKISPEETERKHLGRFNCLNLNTGKLCNLNFSGVEEKNIEIDVSQPMPEENRCSFNSLLVGSVFRTVIASVLVVKIIECQKHNALSFNKRSEVKLCFSSYYKGGYDKEVLLKMEVVV